MSNRGEVHYIPDEPEGKLCHWPTLVAYVGPGFLVCIAYLDPGNLEADLQVCPVVLLFTLPVDETIHYALSTIHYPLLTTVLTIDYSIHFSVYKEKSERT